MNALISAILAACACHATLRALLTSRFASRLADLPTDRSLHCGAVPRIGGLGIAVGVGAALGMASQGQWPPGMAALALAVTAVLAVSLADDVRRLSARARLLAHLVAAGALAYAWDTPVAWLPLATIAIAWGANLYNFMDGADGLAGGMAIFGYAVLALCAQAAGEPALAGVCAAVAGAALGFLPLNWNPARLFMGDAGSVPLGFGAAALGLFGVLEGYWPAAVPLIAFFPFVYDASVTLARRALRGAPLAEAHREHLYQRAALAGLGHRRVALAAYALMAVCAGAALATREFATAVQLAILCAVLALHVTVQIVAERWIEGTRNP